MITSIQQSALKLKLEEARKALLHAADNNVQGAATLEEQIARFTATLQPAPAVAPSFGATAAKGAAKPAFGKKPGQGHVPPAGVNVPEDLSIYRREDLLKFAAALGVPAEELKGKHVGTVREIIETHRKAKEAPKSPSFGRR